MSRGPGRVMRAVLDYLATYDPHPGKPPFPPQVWLSDLTAALFGTDRPTDAQRASVRRAARGLADAGQVEFSARQPSGYRDDKTYTQWRRANSVARSMGLARMDCRVHISEGCVSRIPTEQECAKQIALAARYGISARCSHTRHEVRALRNAS